MPKPMRPVSQHSTSSPTRRPRTGTQTEMQTNPYPKQRCRQDVAMKKIRILVVEDQHVVREGLVAILSFQTDIDVVGEAEDGTAAVSKYKELKPDVVTMDIIMPFISWIL